MLWYHAKELEDERLLYVTCSKLVGPSISHCFTCINSVKDVYTVVTDLVIIYLNFLDPKFLVGHIFKQVLPS